MALVLAVLLLRLAIALLTEKKTKEKITAGNKADVNKTQHPAEFALR